MGFWSTVNRAVDAVDNVVTDTRTRHGAQAEAAAFARKVRLHTTYYTVHRHHLTSGQEDLIHEHRFTEHSKITGLPMTDHMSAAALWLSHGPITATRPRGLQTITEYSEAMEKANGPDIRAQLADYL